MNLQAATLGNFNSATRKPSSSSLFPHSPARQASFEPFPPRPPPSPSTINRNLASAGARHSSAVFSSTIPGDDAVAAAAAADAARVVISSASSSLNCASDEEQKQQLQQQRGTSPLFPVASQLISANSVRDALIEACVEAVDAMCGSGNKEPVEQLRLLLSASATSYEVKYSHVLAQKVVASLLSSGQPEQEDEPAPHLVVLEKVLSAVAKCSAGIAQLAEQQERAESLKMRSNFLTSGLSTGTSSFLQPPGRRRTRAQSACTDDGGGASNNQNGNKSSSNDGSASPVANAIEEDDDAAILASIGVAPLIFLDEDEKRIAFNALLNGSASALVPGLLSVGGASTATGAGAGGALQLQRTPSAVSVMAMQRAASMMMMMQAQQQLQQQQQLSAVPIIVSNSDTVSRLESALRPLSGVLDAPGRESPAPRLVPRLSFNIHRPFCSSGDDVSAFANEKRAAGTTTPAGLKAKLLPASRSFVGHRLSIASISHVVREESLTSLLSEGDRRAPIAEALDIATHADMSENADGFGFDILSTGKNTYIIVGEIGHGMQAPVVRAVSLTDNRDVAIKCLPRPRSIGIASSSLARTARLKLKRMAMEIAALRKCAGHKGLVELIEVIDDKESATLYLVMEFLGSTISAPAANRSSGIFDKRYSSTCVVSMGRRLSSALMYLHKQHIAHMDIKPQNICLRVMDSDEGAGGGGTSHPFVMPVLLDFGVAHVLDAGFDKAARPTLRRGSRATSPGGGSGSSLPRSGAGRSSAIGSHAGPRGSCGCSSGGGGGGVGIAAAGGGSGSGIGTGGSGGNANAMGAASGSGSGSGNGNGGLIKRVSLGGPLFKLDDTDDLKYMKSEWQESAAGRISPQPSSAAGPSMAADEATTAGAMEDKNRRSYALTDGTPAFCPPERFLPEGDQADDFCADVYSLGMVLYVLMHGALPWSCDDSRQYINSIIDMDVPFPPQWPRESELPEIADDDATLVMAASGPLEPRGDTCRCNSDADREQDAKAAAALKEIILRMLEKDPIKRIGIDGAHAALKALDISLKHAL